MTSRSSYATSRSTSPGEPGSGRRRGSGNLNQIAQKAHVLNVVDVQRYDQEVQKFNEAVRKITEAVILPEKNESWQ